MAATEGHGAWRAPWVATAVVAAAMAAEVFGQAPSWRVGGGDVVVVCPLTVGGRFETKTRALTGALAPSAADPAALDGTLSVDLSTLDTGIGLRNTHLKERYLEIQRGEGFARAVLSDVALASPVATASGPTGFTASFTLHGVTRPVSGTADISRTDGGVRVEATFPVTLPAFEIPKPRYLGVGVQDEVEVRVTFTATPGAGGTGAAR
jgi:polyisoprenoid-binding protein YceI